MTEYDRTQRTEVKIAIASKVHYKMLENLFFGLCGQKLNSVVNPFGLLLGGQNNPIDVLSNFFIE